MRFIKDPIKGNIICSSLEFKIFSLPAFNRLHYILQNSMAYLVYPSNKTSRFSHSIGVCHIAGEIYKYGIRNARDDVVVKYLEDKQNFLLKKIFEMGIEETLKSYFGINYEKHIRKFFCNSNINFKKLCNYLDLIFGSYFISDYVLANQVFNKEEYLFINIILLQSVRLFGLLHDYGHLPFSHLFEFAIEDFYEEISDNDDFQKISNKLKVIVEEEDDIHEFIGKKFTILTLKSIRDKEVKNLKDEGKVANFLIFEFLILTLEELFKDKDSYLFSLYEIVSSDLDADRLDYVTRDLYTSGLKYSVDIDRIVKLFKLSERKDESNDKFQFYPAIQSLYDIDLLFENRQILYKMVLSHHKVKKFDYILQKLIKILLYDEVKPDEGIEKISINSLNDVINLVLKLYDTQEGEGAIERIFYYFSQITDYWLLNKLRLKLINNVIGKESNQQFERLANELFGGTKEYKSLYKREYEFQTFLDDLSNSVKMTKEDILIFLEESYKKIEDNLGILIAYTKTPKLPKNLQLIDIQTDEKFSYNPKVFDYKTKFFIYANNDKTIIINEIKEELKKDV